jgi:hypothetical protein
MQCHVLGGSWIHDPFAHALEICSITHYKCIILVVICSFTLIIYFIAKMHNVARFVAIEALFCALARKWCVPLVLLPQYGGILILGLLLFALWHLMHQTRCHIVYCKLVHQIVYKAVIKYFKPCTTTLVNYFNYYFFISGSVNHYS